MRRPSATAAAQIPSRAHQAAHRLSRGNPWGAHAGTASSAPMPGIRRARRRQERSQHSRSTSAWQDGRRRRRARRRTASSRARAVPRASSRLVTFAQATNRTRPTAAINTRSAGRTRRVTLSARVLTRTSTGPPLPKSSSAAIGRFTVRAAAVPSAAACPGCCPGSAVRTPEGSHRSVRRRRHDVRSPQQRIAIRKIEPRGSDANHLALRPLICRVRPTTFGSPLNVDRQKRSLRIATLLLPATASSGRKNLPMAALTPKVANADGDNDPPLMRSVSFP